MTKTVSINWRRCAVCRRKVDRTTCRRLVWRRSDGLLGWDPPSSQVGRSVYVCQTASCLAQASQQQGRKLAKALKRQIPDAIVLALPQLESKEAASSDPQQSTCL